jgi:hypothetical protein
VFLPSNLLYIDYSSVELTEEEYILVRNCRCLKSHRVQTLKMFERKGRQWSIKKMGPWVAISFEKAFSLSLTMIFG